MPIDIDRLRELLGAIAQTDIAEVTLKSDDFELTVRRGGTGLPAVSPVPVAVSIPPTPAAMSAPAAEPTSPPANEFKGAEITSPMVGTFYRAPAPDEAPYVEMGDRVSTGQAVCIIEAMKLMNEIEAEVSGKVVEILAENGQPVEYGQVLMRVQPD